MASFKIPKAHHGGLAKLVAQEEGSRQKLLSSLRNVPAAATGPDALSKRVSSEAAIPLEDVSNVITTLVSLYSLQTYLKLSTSKLAEQICEAMIESGDKELDIAADSERFAGYLSELLETRSLIISSKIVDVWVEHEHAFCSAQIFTDLRPVFGSDSSSPLATGTVHMLKLSYHETDVIKDIYVAMDDSDLEKLREVLDVATARGETLKSVLREAKITYFE